LEKGQLDILEAALQAGMDPNTIICDCGDSPLLHAAALGGNPACVAVLLAGGADPLAGDKHGSLPLHQGCARGHVAVVLQLLAAGPAGSPAARTQAGLQAMHMGSVLVGPEPLQTHSC